MYLCCLGRSYGFQGPSQISACFTFQCILTDRLIPNKYQAGISICLFYFSRWHQRGHNIVSEHTLANVFQRFQCLQHQEDHSLLLLSSFFATNLSANAVTLNSFVEKEYPFSTSLNGENDFSFSAFITLDFLYSDSISVKSFCFVCHTSKLAIHCYVSIASPRHSIIIYCFIVLW